MKGVCAERKKARLLRRFHRKCDRLGIPRDVRLRLIRMADATGENLKAPDWYAGRAGGQQQ